MQDDTKLHVSLVRANMEYDMGKETKVKALLTIKIAKIIKLNSFSLSVITNLDVIVFAFL